MPLGVHGEPVQDWCLNAACSLGQVDRQSVNSATPSAYVYGKPAWGRRLRARRAVRTNRGRGGADDFWDAHQAACFGVVKIPWTII